MASCSSPCRHRAVVPLLLVLAVAHAAPAATACATATDATAEAPARDHDQEVFPRNHDLAPAAGDVADVPMIAAGCVKSALEASRPCAPDVLLTLVSGTVHLSEGCCAVLVQAGEKCVADVFADVPFGHALLPVVSRVCGLVASIV
ncbi:hypothetical protein ACP70R_000591 [Stipagrostis hirtigluma subsp. patula]